ncbi:MAG: helix-turn-helix transcriptional regulator [Ruminococcus sp.]|nr:helix-turn-helix transcriptional regulator [Ruminococcus sp.]
MALSEQAEKTNRIIFRGVGERLKALRKNKGMTQNEVAQALGIRRQELCFFENGTRDLKTELTIKFAKFYNVSCDYLLTGEEYSNNKTDKQKQQVENKLNATTVELINSDDIYIDFINFIFSEETELCKQVMLLIKDTKQAYEKYFDYISRFSNNNIHIYAQEQFNQRENISLTIGNTTLNPKKEYGNEIKYELEISKNYSNKIEINQNKINTLMGELVLAFIHSKHNKISRIETTFNEKYKELQDFYNEVVNKFEYDIDIFGTINLDTIVSEYKKE